MCFGSARSRYLRTTKKWFCLLLLQQRPSHHCPISKFKRLSVPTTPSESSLKDRLSLDPSSPEISRCARPDRQTHTHTHTELNLCRPRQATVPAEAMLSSSLRNNSCSIQNEGKQWGGKWVVHGPPFYLGYDTSLLGYIDISSR